MLIRIAFYVMDQHPVPRDITGFKFQLVGFMTIKQFGYVVFGLIIAFIFFKLPISFFKYPFAAFAAFAGIAFAFIPIQERPLEEWVINMIRSIYAPTQYVWQKQNVLPDYMIPLAKGAVVIDPATKKSEAEIAARQHQQARIKLQQYLRTIQPGQDELLDNKEKGDLQQITGLFQEGTAGGQIVSPPTVRRTPFIQPQESVAVASATKRFVTPSLTPGIIAGLVKAEDMVLPGMLIHIYDTAGKQTRLFKTNMMGKFSSAVALPSGSYKVSVEDPTRRHTFNDFSFTISEEGVRPWLITGTTTKK